jgi:hypothetical protein
LKRRSPICAPKDIYVNYVYEYDIHNQACNSSLQDPKSIVVQRLQSDWTSEELYKRNLRSYITDVTRITKIMDVSQEYNNRETIRFYISIKTNKNFIPTLRGVFELVFEKLQKQHFSTSKKNINWGDMVIIPTRK